MCISSRTQAKKRRRLTVIALLALGMLINHMAGAVEMPEFNKLIQSATVNGDVRVIVTLQPPALPERANKSSHDFDEIVKTEMATVQELVLGKLHAGSLISSARHYDFTPQFAATVTANGLNALLSDPAVKAIQEDLLERATLEQSVPFIYPGNDSFPYTGGGQVVVVLDNGVDKTHPFLDGKVISEACYSTTISGFVTSNSICPGGVASSTAADSGVPCNLAFDSGCVHGTHVAGIVAGFQSDNFHGVAKWASIIAVQVFSAFPNSALCGGANCVLSWSSDSLAGLNRAYELRNTFNITAVNLSISGGGPFDAACDTDPRKPIIDLLKAAGIATVISSGNDGYTTGVSQPACISTAIAVGATGHTDNVRAVFSDSGNLLDLYAPGVSIRSSVPPNGLFASLTGTSMAAPHVAGAWAIMKDAKPAATVDQIETAFKSTGFPVTVNGVTRKRIDIDQALAALGASPPAGAAYNPVAPCRFVDTRIAEGPIAAGSSRAFRVAGTGISGQGGAPTCGIPTTAKAVVVNIAAVKASANGNLQITPYGAPMTGTSLLTYKAGVNIANSTEISICQPGCLFDINIFSLESAQVVGDVMGWFE